MQRGTGYRTVRIDYIYQAPLGKPQRKLLFLVARPLRGLGGGGFKGRSTKKK